jgi:hypothetical protein
MKKTTIIMMICLVGLLSNLIASINVYVGNPHSTVGNVVAPLDYRRLNSVSQAIYLSSEVGLFGKITSIQYTVHPGTNFGNLPPEKMVSFFVGTTNLTVFTANGWINPNTLTHVFTGTLPETLVGNTFTIPFDAPFDYHSGNLVIMGHRHLDTEVFVSPNAMGVRSTDLPLNTFRAIARIENTYINPMNPGQSTHLLLNRPNVRIFFEGESEDDPNIVTRFPFTEGFEGMQFPPVGWSINPPTASNGTSWFSFGHDAYEGYWSAASASWFGGNALHPNNWLITPRLILPDGLPMKLNFFAASQDWEYPIEHYGVYLSTTGKQVADFSILLHSETLTNDEWVQRTIDLSAYTGREVYLAFRHFNSTDQFLVKIDAISVYAVVDFDLMAVSVAGSLIPRVDSLTEYIVTVKNVGSQDVSNYTVKLMKLIDDEPVELTTVSGTAINAGATNDIAISWTPTAEGKFQIFGEIIFAEDQHVPNNQTPLFNVTVLPADVVTTNVGDTQSNLYTVTHPFNYNARNNFSQTIYYEDEIDCHGNILAINYNFSNHWGEIPAGVPVRIWMTTTDVKTFSSSTAWIPHGGFTLVYQGHLPVTKSGEYTVEIPLDTPFYYGGGNLVVMTSRSWVIGGTTYSNSNLWQITDTPGLNRTLNISATTQLILQTLDRGERHQNIPNVSFIFDTSGCGHLAGTVAHNGTPLSDVKISIIGSARHAYSDAQGEYTIRHITPNTIGLIASKLMYSTQVFDSIVINADLTTTHKINMPLAQNELAALSISGSSFASIGQPTPYYITIRNEGANTIAGSAYTIRLMQDGTDTELTSVSGTTLLSGQSNQIIVPWTPTTTGNIDLYGLIDFPADEYLDNNKTDIFRVEVHTAGSIVRYIGDPDSEHTNTTYPISFHVFNSISQTIFHETEIGSYGLITHIAYTVNSRGNSAGNIPVRIFMRTVEQDTFLPGPTWLAINTFTEVYTGLINIGVEGTYEIVFPLTTPFNYTGGNLVICTFKPWYTDPQTGNTMKVSSVSSPRTHRQASSLNEIILNSFHISFTGGVPISEIPNVRMVINSGPMGALSGTITRGGNPVAGATVSVDGTSIKAISNNAGQYMLSYIPVGVINITATKVGYNDYKSQSITIINGTTATHNIVMEELPKVNVSGTVLASDTGEGLSGAKVRLTGYAEYVGFETDANGLFTISGVYTDKTYTLYITHPRYTTHRDGTISVGSSDLIIEDITLQERLVAVSNVVATAISNSQVNLTWVPPSFSENATLDNTTDETQKKQVVSIDDSGFRTHPLVDIFARKLTDESRNIPNRRNVAVNTEQNVPTIQNSSRVLLGYHIYRASLENLENKGNWDVVYKDAQGTSIEDTGWGDVENGLYRYIVVAVYTDDNQAEPVFSNIIEKIPLATVNVTINTVDGVVPTGAIVRLVNNQNPEYTYTQNAEDNLVVFPVVPYGTYTLSISHPNYVLHINNIFVVDSGLVGYIHTIGLPVTILDEGFESSTFPPVGWTMIDADGDGINWRLSTTFVDPGGPPPAAHTGTRYAFSESYRNDTQGGIGTAITPDNFLISPKVNIPAETTDVVLYYHVLTFLPNWPAEVYSVMISTSTPTVANFVPLFTETLTANENIWRERTISLTEYAGETIHIAFRHHTPVGGDMFALGIDSIEIIYAVGCTNEADIVSVPSVTTLRANYPNPFNPTTNIQFDIAVEGHVQINVFNIRGQRVTTLVNEHLGVGSHNVVWDGTNRIGRNVSSGLYFYKMTVGEYTETRKMLLMK